MVDINFNLVSQFVGIKDGPKLLNNPTSLKFGPDGRLYVTELSGNIRAFTIALQQGQYVATAVENINLVKTIQNHNDDGSLSSEANRQVTGLEVAGTATNPILYVSSSDPRIAQNTGELNLDTNSGVITRLTWTGTTWDAVDIIRGLPRSEENHATNGLILSPDGTKLYVAQGGNTNNGAPSQYFSYTGEYALSGTVLEIDLVNLNSRPILTDPVGAQGGKPRKYIYDLPTLDDPSVANNGSRESAAGLDVAGPWGGNDGFNMAVLPADAPLRIYADGFRNPYDLAFIGGKLYTVDNGSNNGLGSNPIVGADGQVTNQPNDGGAGNPEPLFWVQENGYYGHPAPARANQDLAWTVYNNAGTADTLLSPNTVPNLSALVPDSLNIQDGYLIDPSKFTANATRLAQSGVRVPYTSPQSPSLVNVGSSSNGLVAYNGDAFGGALKNALLVAQFNGNITALNLSADGTKVAPLKQPGSDGILGTADDVTVAANGVYSIVTGLSTPLDVTVGPDGTVWVAELGADFVKVYAPSDLQLPDDPDFDNDGINNNVDPFIRDATNGNSVIVQAGQTLVWDFDPNQDNNLPGPNGYGGGLTGVMVNGQTDFEKFFQEPSTLEGQNIKLDNVKFLTAAGGGTIVVENVSNGNPLGNGNNGEYLFHTGVAVNPGVETFTVKWTAVNPASELTGNFQQIGGYLGTGDQSNYLKIAAIKDPRGEIVVSLENGDQTVSESFIQADDLFEVASLPTSGKIFFKLTVDPLTATATPKITYETLSGNKTVSGSPLNLSGSNVLKAIKGQNLIQGKQSGLAVGLFSTNDGQPAASTFQAIFDGIEITATGSTQQTVLYRVNAGGGLIAATDGGPNWAADTGSFLSNAGSNNKSSFSVTPGPTVAPTTPAGIFLSERWDAANDPAGEMQWVFNTPNPGLYEVRLFMGDGYSLTSAPGQRVFDVAIEGQVPSNLNDVDLSKQFGSQVGGMLSNVVAVTDGKLNIEFLHGVQNPLVNGIEIIQLGTSIPATPVISLVNAQSQVSENQGQIQVAIASNVSIPSGQTVTVNFEVRPGTATPGVDYLFTGGTFNASTGIYSGSLTIPANSTQGSVGINILQDTLKEGSEAFSVAITGVSTNATVGSSNTATITIADDDTPIAPGTIVYRVNAGGGEVAATDGGPNWAADTGSFLVNAGSNNKSGSGVFQRAANLPASTPTSIFYSERWDDLGDPAGEMQWGFDVANGLYEVRLFMGDSYSLTSLPGQRVFDVALEGQVPTNLDNVDLSGQLGFKVGGMFSNVVSVTDGQLNIEFLHGSQNPLVNGIEIISLGDGGTPPTIPSVSIVNTTASAAEGNQVQISLATDVSVPASQSVTVNFEIRPGTATPGVDYAFTGGSFNATNGIYSGTVTIAGGSGDATFNLDLLQDTLVEGSEAFSVAITGVSPNAKVGSNATATVTITDDDTPTTPTTTVLYRVNAGGAEVAATDGGLAWGRDTTKFNSPYLVNAGSNTTAYSATPIDLSLVGSYAAPASLFNRERFDGDNDPAGNMKYAFDVAAGQEVEVRLYLAETFPALYDFNRNGNPSGDRVFDVSVDGVVPAAFQDLDAYVLAGNAFHKATVVTHRFISDGSVDLEFLRKAQSPAVKGIEVVALGTTTQPPQQTTISLASATAQATEGNQVQIGLNANAAIPTGQSVTVNFEIRPGTATPGVDYQFTGGTFNATTGIYTGSVSLPANATSANLTVDLLQDTLQEGNEAFSVVITGTSPNAKVGSTATAAITIVDDDNGTTPSPSKVLYRVNAGGAEVAATDGGLAWGRDTSKFNSPFLTNPGSNTTAYADTPIDLSLVGDYAAPASLFVRERFDDETDPLGNMKYGFDVAAGKQVEVRLYLAETFTNLYDSNRNGNPSGDRIFDVSVDGSVPAAFKGLDPYVLAGNAFNKGAVVTHRLISDGTVDLEFFKKVQNPAVKGIEIVEVGSTDNPPPPPPPAAVGAATLGINANNNFIQQSNFNPNSFQIKNVGEKKIAKVEIDVTGALYPDSVFDPFGQAGDTGSKPITIDTEGGTGVVAPSQSSYIGQGGKAGYRGIQLTFSEAVNGGFAPGETLGFSVDMDPNSIAGSQKGTLDGGSSPAWDVGGVSGAELIGSKFTVTFTDGTTATGQLQGTANQSGSHGLATQAAPAGSVSLSVNGLSGGGVGTYSQGGPSVIVNGPAGATARVVLTKGFIQPVNNNFTEPYKSQLDVQLAALAGSNFPANNAVEFQTVDVTLTGSPQDISNLFNFTGVANYNFAGEDQLPLGFVASLVDPAQNNLPIGPVSQPIYLKYAAPAAAALAANSDPLTGEPLAAPTATSLAVEPADAVTQGGSETLSSAEAANQQIDPLATALPAAFEPVALQPETSLALGIAPAQSADSTEETSGASLVPVGPVIEPITANGF